MDDYGAVTPVEDGKKKFRFNIHNNDKSTVRIFRLFSENEKLRLQWISAIEQVIKVLSPKVFTFRNIVILLIFVWNIIKAPKLDNTRTKIVQRTQDDENSIRRCARLYVRGK